MADPVSIAAILEQIHVPLGNLEGLLDGLGDLAAALGIDAQSVDDQLQRRRIARVGFVEVANFAADPGAVETRFDELREHFAAVFLLEKDWREDDDALPFQR